MASSHSGLQKQVLSLYKRCMLVAKRKPNPEKAMQYVRDEFHNPQVKRNEFRRIEFLLRQGEKQLKMLSRDTAVDFTKH